MTPRELLLIIGAPGAGKSTLMAKLTDSCSRTPVAAPVGHDVLRPLIPVDGWSAAEIGRRRDGHAGTDALSMSVQPRVVQWLATHPHHLLLAEGDRLANLRFVAEANRAGYYVTLIYLDAPGHVLDARCHARGTTQDARWRAGRATKVRRLAEHAAAAGVPVYRFPATAAVPTLAIAARTRMPVLRYLVPPGVC